MTLPSPPPSPDGLQGLARALALVEPELADVTGLTFGVGHRALAEQKRPPRVVWVPSADDYSQRGAQQANPWAEGTRWAGVAAHVWERDLVTCETLVHRVWLALRAVAMGSVRNFAGAWVTQDEPVAGWSRLGEVYVLSFQLGIPIVRAPYPEVTPTDYPKESPDSLNPGELGS